MTISFEHLHNITGGRIGVFDAPCPSCGPDRRSPVNRRREVFRAWRDSPGFITYRCARCEIEGYAHDGAAGGRRLDPVAIEQGKARGQERQRIESADSLRKSRWLWSMRLPIAGSIAETYLRKCRGYGGTLPNTIAFLPTRGDHGPAMIAAFGLAWEIEPGEIIIDDTAVRGVHLTKLKPDGSGKAGTDNDKITVGTSSFGSPIVLAPPNDGLGLAICEGIEDGLSIFESTGLGVWAAGTANRMPALAAVVPDYIEAVTIVADADNTGRTNAEKLAHALRPHSGEVRLIVPPQAQEGAAA